ncbi:MAG: hypothetical protein A4E20_01290 [Nitrospira sp. SG-bin2]|uniref:ssDNA-binding protein n=1 Tax=Nitrospira cf. moscoviensis SBR1015 TaxID=96242 RepID=UPI000A0E8206|nr:ssDNA-binding protein [Nitrospira cf. moscoviensis SBR1015]OQW34838.1 MAG: hypothetical protein A4E20_01290 [Nitrospira sp. SG-bin2]
MSEQKRETFVTPKGTAKWIRVNEPDTKYKDEGEYKVSLLLGGKEAEQMKTKIDAAIKVSVDAAKAANKGKKIKQADAPYRADVDKEGNETGLTMFNFKAKASGVKKKDNKPWTFRPAVFDAKKTPIPVTVAVWSGSEVKVAYQLKPFGESNYSPTVGAGVSLALQAVQVIKLVTGQGRDAAAFGFGEEEGEAVQAGEAPAGGQDTTDEEF